ncbi:MAG: DUF5658 family protein [Pseudomonadota bacterium]
MGTGGEDASGDGEAGEPAAGAAPRTAPRDETRGSDTVFEEGAAADEAGDNPASAHDRGRAEDADPNRLRRRRYWSHGLAVCTIAFGGLDCVSTDLALRLEGAVEANPVVRALQERLGAAWIWPKMALHGVLAAIVLAHPTRETLLTLGLIAALTLGAALSNLMLHQELLTAMAEQARLFARWIFGAAPAAAG